MNSSIRLTALAILLNVTIPVSGAPRGELDAGFGDHGRTLLRTHGSTVGFAVAQQSTGQLVVAGAALGVDPLSAFVVVRLQADGSLDETFGIDGVATVASAGFATSIAVQADDSIVVAGGSTDFVLARFRADGAVDTTFGAGGVATLDLGGFDEGISAILLQPEGRIAVVGTTDAHGDYDIAFARFMQQGSLDGSFGDGSVPGVTLFRGQPAYIASGLVRHADGSLLACGTGEATVSGLSSSRMLAVRVTETGLSDAGFGVNGIWLVAPRGAHASVSGCVALSDGTTLLAGRIGTDVAIARLSVEGALDTSFGDGGVSIIDIGALDSALAITPLDNGVFALAGETWASDLSFASDMFMALFDAGTGLLDPEFGNNGITLADFRVAGHSSVANARGLLRQADGKLVAVGSSTELDTGTSAIALARVDPDGAGSIGIAGFSGSSVAAIESSAKVAVTVRRTGGSSGALSVAYTTEPGTAVSPQDFTEVSGILTWATGDMTNKLIEVPIVSDNNDEPEESFSVVLFDSSGGLAGSRVGVRIEAHAAVPPPVAPPTPAAGGGGGVALEILLCALAALSARRARPTLRRSSRGAPSRSTRAAGRHRSTLV